MIKFRIKERLDALGKDHKWLIRESGIPRATILKLLNEPVGMIRWEFFGILHHIFDCNPGKLFVVNKQGIARIPLLQVCTEAGTTRYTLTHKVRKALRAGEATIHRYQKFNNIVKSNEGNLRKRKELLEKVDRDIAAIPPTKRPSRSFKLNVIEHIYIALYGENLKEQPELYLSDLIYIEDAENHAE